MKIAFSSLRDVVTDQLRQQIFEGVFRPGTHLIEQSLADQYGVSRGPVRDAIQQLQQEGLVQVLPRRGTIVTEISLQEAWEIYALRGHLEGLAVKFAAPFWTDEHSQLLMALLAEMEEMGSDDWLRAIDLDQRFHHVILDAAGNQTLKHVYHTLDSKVVACFLAVKRYLGGMPAEMADRHRDLTQAMAQRDFWRAEILAIKHWSDTAARFRVLVGNT